MSDITYSDAPKPLTQKERDLVKRIFSDWFEIPGEWKGSLRAYLESDPPVLGKAALGGSLMTAAFVTIDGTQQRVRVGPAGSGPGGTGRALWVD